MTPHEFRHHDIISKHQRTTGKRHFNKTNATVNGMLILFVVSAVFFAL